MRLRENCHDESARIAYNRLEFTVQNRGRPVAARPLRETHAEENRFMITPLAKGILFVGLTLLWFGLWLVPAAAQPLLDKGNPPDAPKADLPPANPLPIEPGYLGVSTDDRREGGRGVRVMDVVAGGPADKAGLKKGDLITGVDGKAVRGTPDMGAAMGPLPPGSQVSFEIERGGQIQKITAMLGKRPESAERRPELLDRNPEPLPEPQPGAGEPGVPRPAGGPRPPVIEQPRAEQPRAEPARRSLLGVRTQPVTEEIRRRLRLPSTSGALVVSRTLGSPAEKAGIPLDAVIVAVNNAPVESPHDLARLVTEAGSGQEVELTYIVEGETRRIKVVLTDAVGEPPAALPGGPSRPRLPARPLAPQDEAARIDVLERHVQELEQRLHELEQSSRKPN
jgi:membrane-associated protease RseP (regulator of RpoE activity)